MSDRSRDVSAELTEVRTVLSRAETALAHVELMAGCKDGDPDAAKIADDLLIVVTILGRWKRAGSRRRTGSHVIEAAKRLRPCPS